VALSRCTSLEGISLKEPIRKDEIFVKPEVLNFARNYNDKNIISSALIQSKADKEYHDAMQAFDAGDMQKALDNFFLAIHSRYDIEKPAAKRLLRRKLNLFNEQKNEIKQLKEDAQKKENFLKELAVEYVQMGRDCEKAGFKEAAIKNYEKALQLCPDIPEAKRKLKKLSK
jgi:tetratricopeptide (TPR) repeat protein